MMLHHQHFAPSNSKTVSIVNHHTRISIVNHRRVHAIQNARNTSITSSKNPFFGISPPPPPTKLRRCAASQTEAPSSSSSSSPSQAESEANLSNFLAWAIANGVEGIGTANAKIALFSSESGERGLVSIAALRRGETFATIPLRLAITDDPEDEESNTLVGADAAWSVRLACKLLRLQSEGDACPWMPYLKVLPTTVPSPLTSFSWKDTQSIAYEPARKEIDRTTWLASAAWSSLPPGATTTTTTTTRTTTTTTAKTDQSPPSEPEMNKTADREAFEKMLAVVHSRTFGSAGRSGGVGVRMLVPLVDMLNHAGDVDVAESTAGPTAPSVCQPADNVRWDIVSKIGGEFLMVLTATRDIDAGEEMLLSYGERGNDDFLIHYGFIPPRNVHDDVKLFSSIEDAIDWHLRTYVPLGKLTAPQLQTAITAAYVAAGKQEEEEVEGSAEKAEAAAEAALAAMPAAEADKAREEKAAIKLLNRGRTDARLIAAFESLHGAARVAGGPVCENCQDHVRQAVAARAVEILQSMRSMTGFQLDRELVALAGSVGEDEHGFMGAAVTYGNAIASSRWRTEILSSSSSASLDKDGEVVVVDTGAEVLQGGDAALFEALKKVAPPPSTASTSVFKDVEAADDDGGDSLEQSSSNRNSFFNNQRTVSMYNVYKGMILWDAVLLSEPSS